MAAPTISSVTPAWASTLGGAVITIAGTAFDTPAPVVVRVAGTVVTPATITATQATFAAPAHAVGPVAVTVTNADGAASALLTYVAVPTIASITPNAGRTKGGNVIAIAGTNFRTATIAPDGYVGGDALQTVKVTFAGERAPWAEAASPTLVYARVPEWRGSATTPMPLVQSVRLANLDDAGVERANENVTVTTGYTVDRPSLVPSCLLMEVCRELIHVLKRHLLVNVAMTISRDYDDDPATVDRLRDAAPSIHLIGPSIHNRRGPYAVPREDSEGDALGPWTRAQPPVVADLVFDLRAWTVNSFHTANLAQQFLLLFRDLPWLTVGAVRYEVEVDWERYPDLAATPSFSDVEGFASGLVIRGVHLDDDSATFIERGWSVTANGGDPTLDVETR